MLRCSTAAFSWSLHSYRRFSSNRVGIRDSDIIGIRNCASRKAEWRRSFGTNHNSNTFSHNGHSIAAALHLLGLATSSHHPSAKSLSSLLSLSLTRKELRAAYFVAAKHSHPDSAVAAVTVDALTTTASSTTSSASSMDKSQAPIVDPTERFRAVTEAYELLLHWISRDSKSSFDDDYDDVMAVDEEEAYRQACLEWLGQTAETVEESKQCPAFRQWLHGRTDAAWHWQNFFMLHGGLMARRLRQRPTLLPLSKHDTETRASTTTANDERVNQSSKSHRRRRRQP
jgi:hypothetical protein